MKGFMHSVATYLGTHFVLLGPHLPPERPDLVKAWIEHGAGTSLLSNIMRVTDDCLSHGFMLQTSSFTKHVPKHAMLI